MAGGAAAALSVFNPTSALAAAARSRKGVLTPVELLGPLRPVADARDGVARLELPPGFGYRSFGVAGSRMSDGNICPTAHDGSAAFELPGGRLRLIRNHEVDDPSDRKSVV